MKKPNIVYIHAHDLGRFCEPMGYDIPSPNLMRLAQQGTLFRQCHASAPTCAPSRAALVTGEYPHCCGMLGLPMQGKLGYKLNDFSRHIARFLKDNGYVTALSGVQHVAQLPDDPKKLLPYDRFLNHTPTAQQEFDPALTVPAAIDFIMEEHDRPFFLSVGFLDPHRDGRDDSRIFVQSQPMYEPADIDIQARYCRPWPHMPDNRITRREMANFKIGVKMMDDDVGRVLRALEHPELWENTLIIFTTDHGPGVSEMKATLTDRGTGVTTIIKAPDNPAYGLSELFNKGDVEDAMIQHMDLYPTICDIIGADKPEWLQGKSLMPLLRGEVSELHEAIFTEQTYHASPIPRPLRGVRTNRYKYIRSYKKDQARGVDRGPAHEYWDTFGYTSQEFPDEMLFDLVFDPNEANNLANDPAQREALQEMRSRLDAWMRETKDPLIHGEIPLPPAMSTPQA
jgi:N-sulfoglucosamine sulfohydrolase